MRSTLPVDPCIHAAFGASNPPDFEVYSSIAPIFSATNPNFSGGHHFSLQTFPILMGCLTLAELKPYRHVSLYKHANYGLFGELISHSFAFYCFNTDHFASTSSRTNQAMDIVLDKQPLLWTYYVQAVHKLSLDC